jgi:hypothetical protein
MSSRTFSFGGAIGAMVGQDPSMDIIPNASFQFANTRMSMDDGTDSVSGSESYALLTLGTGFVFSERYSLNPSLSIPVGADAYDVSFGIMGAINFGR